MPTTARGASTVTVAPSRREARASGGGGGAAPGAGQRSLYDEVTARVIADLEAGCVPWVQPWAAAGPSPAIGLPANAATGRHYSGINILILWGALLDSGWQAQRWLTFRQALGLGGSVRRGEHGVTVFYADRFVPKQPCGTGRGASAPAPGRGGWRDSDRTRAGEEGEPASVPFLKRFTVFNVAQCDGLDPALAVPPAPAPVALQVPAAEAVIAASGVPFRIMGDRAFYSPGRDTIVVPPQAAYFEAINWYRTALHELTHATGHATRLGRDLSASFGTPGYAREELIAEMGSAFLCASLGIAPTVRHADYLAGWLDVLRADSRAIFRAASAASRAADWLLARAAPDTGAAA